MFLAFNEIILKANPHQWQAAHYQQRYGSIDRVARLSVKHAK